MEKKLTTIIIGRQFGAGGRELGELLAKKLGIPYYDRSLLKVAAQRLGFDEEIFDNADERKPSILRSMLSINYGAMAADYSISSLNREKIYMAQSDVIRQLAQEGPAVFVGRTADYITRDMPHRLSIFRIVHLGIIYTDKMAQQHIDRHQSPDTIQKFHLSRII